MKTKTAVGSIFGILERHLFNAILSVVLPGERMTAAMIYETIWDLVHKEFRERKNRHSQSHPERRIRKEAP